MRPNNDSLVGKVKELYRFCRERDVKIKLELYSNHPDDIAKFVHIKNPGTVINDKRLSTNDLVTSYKLVIRQSNSFLKCIKGFGIYKNLDVLDIHFRHFKISNDTKNTCNV
uniref:Photolyase/cryptochrome alpha/beta domain-containing protein n=1 Tax=Strongyloides venezuelensis TaxID=75913 RepID=A0A0K0EUZ0_STRVS